MPTIINGCGTWYYGKRRTHRVKAVCSQCQAFAELESYDTTLYVVALMVPIVPLGQKRILDKCPNCQRHKIISLKAWEAGKAKAFGDVLERLQADPDDKPTIQTALGLATVYQDEAAFDKLADVLAGHRTDDPEIQAQLGAAYEYFSRWPDAEAAYRRAYAVLPDDDLRERLAVCLLKQDRPEEAADYVRHVFDSKDPDKAWLVFWLVEGFVAAGMHEQALKVMDVRDDLWPHLVKDKAYVKQRKTADRHKLTGKPVPSTYLRESGRTGFREGSGLGFKWPKYVAAALVLGLAALYFGVALYRGQSRPVYLVNGWTKPYLVTVNGEAHQLQPNVPTKIAVPEGEVTVESGLGDDNPQTVTVETPFFSRPFKAPVFVINPDRLALLERDETVYTDNATAPPNPPEFAAGRLLTEFAGVDYEFEPFPPQVQAKAGSKITKTRVGVIPVAGTQDRIFQAAGALPPDQAREYMRRLLRLDPDDVLALSWLTTVLPPAEAIAFVRPRLADRPVRVEWHRVYQTLVEQAEPDTDMKPAYRQLVAETKRSPAAVYLLGRLEDGPAGERMYEEAATGNPPVPQACGGLRFRLLVRGEFDRALPWAKKGVDLDPANPALRAWYQESLLAAGQYKDLLAATDQAGTGRVLAIRERLTAHVALGEAGAALGEINAALAQFGIAPGNPAAARFRQTLELVLAEVERDRPKYLTLADRAGSTDGFATKFLKEDFKGAAAAAPGPARGGRVRDWEFDATRAGLLYLAGAKAKDAAFADGQWAALGEALGHGDRDARRLSAVLGGKHPFDAGWLTGAMLNPSLKRVVLAACARKYPAPAGDLMGLSKRLDFERDEVSLCLRYATE